MTDETDRETELVSQDPPVDRAGSCNKSIIKIK